MQLDLRNNRDVLAGLLFTAFGILAVLVARRYPFGTAMHMGPGYFPTVLGAVLIFLGLAVVARGLVSAARVKGEWGWRPLALVVLAIVLFAFLMPRAGLLPALAAAILTSAAGGREFRFKEVVVVAALMSVLAGAVLVYALKLPYPLIVGLPWIS